MNRRHFLHTAGIGSLIAACWPTLAQTAKPQNPPVRLTFTTSTVLQNPGATAITVAIGVNGPSTAWAEYGETDQLGQVATGARHGLKPYDSLAHLIRLEGLRPGRRYYYRVRACPVDFRGAYDIRRGESFATQIFSFRTFDPQAKEARFAVWNDLHENAATLTALNEKTSQAPADFLVWNGDITNDNYREDRMVEHYLGGTGHPFASETPLVFARGNHDTRGPAARSLPRILEAPGGRFYYSFRHGPLACVVLDAGEDKPDTTPVYAGLGDFVAYRQEQAAWLEAELKQSWIRKAPFRVAFCHVPLWWKDKGYARDSTDARWEWHRLLVKSKFSAVISGHTHSHALFRPDAIKRYAQLVGGGPKPENATLIRGWVTAKELKLSLFALDGRELAGWSAKA
jgi:acid phosphatase type 7